VDLQFAVMTLWYDANSMCRLPRHVYNESAAGCVALPAALASCLITAASGCMGVFAKAAFTLRDVR